MPVQARYDSYHQDQRQFFDELVTEDWPQGYLSHEHDLLWGFEIKNLLARANKPGRILDVGCGAGYHDLLLAQAPYVQEVIGIDYSPLSIARANEAFAHPKVKRMVSDIFDFSPERKFDLTASFQVIEHLTDPLAFLKRSADLTRQLGYVAIFTPNRMRWENRRQLTHGYPLYKEDVMHFQEYTLAELVTMGKQVGLHFHKSFGYLLKIPAEWRWVPKNYRVKLHLGYLFPRLASRMTVIFRKP